MRTWTELYDTLPADGWLTEAEAQLLWLTAFDVAGPILEVGSYCGRSTVLLASLGRPVYAVDPFDGFTEDRCGDEIAAVLAGNLAERGIENVEVFRQRIEEWTPRPVGVAYLDGDHTYQGTLNQINVATACQARVIAIHDVAESGGGAEIKRATLERLGPWQSRVERLAVWRVR